MATKLKKIVSTTQKESKLLRRLKSYKGKLNEFYEKRMMTVSSLMRKSDSLRDSLRMPKPKKLNSRKLTKRLKLRNKDWRSSTRQKWDLTTPRKVKQVIYSPI